MSISFQAKDPSILSKQLAFQEVVVSTTDSNLYVPVAPGTTTVLDINEPLSAAFIVAIDAAGAAVVTLAATIVTSAAGVALSGISTPTAGLAGYEYLVIKYKVAE